MVRRKIAVWKITALSAALATGIVAQADAAGYPEKPVRVVVPFAAGGGTDTLSRYLAEELSKTLGQQFVVENVAGAGGNIGTVQVKDAAPDGCTLLIVTPATAINNTLYKNPGYDAVADFAPIAGWTKQPLIFVANTSFEPNNLKEIVDYSKAHPGELQYSSGGVGLINTEEMELFKIKADADITQIPYQGMGPALTALMGNVVPVTVDSIASSGPFVKSGKVKPIAVTTAG